MRERLRNALGKKKQIHTMQIGTFHAICLAFLKDQGREFSILDEEGAQEIARGIIEEYQLKDTVKKFLYRVSGWKAEGEVPQEDTDAFLAYQKYLEEHPEMQKKLIRKLIQKQRIKREYQMAYRAGKIAKETKDTSIRSVNLATKIARKAQEVFVRNVTTLISMGLLLILLLSVMTGFASCSAMFSNGISTVIASSYIADPDEIEKAELYYTQLEASLQQKINQMEARYPRKR